MEQHARAATERGAAAGVDRPPQSRRARAGLGTQEKSQPLCRNDIPPSRSRATAGRPAFPPSRLRRFGAASCALALRRAGPPSRLRRYGAASCGLALRRASPPSRLRRYGAASCALALRRAGPPSRLPAFAPSALRRGRLRSRASARQAASGQDNRFCKSAR